MRLTIPTVCLAWGALTAVPGIAAGIPDIERGRALYENHCEVCHSSKVHTRINRIAISIEELRQIVDNWQREERLRWSPQDVEDVVQFLNATHYNF